MSKDYHRQHYIPKSILKRFTNETGKLWYLDWTKNPNHDLISPQRPKTCFYKQLTTSVRLADGNYDHVAVHHFSRFEQSFAEFSEWYIGQLEKGKAPDLAPKQLELLREFSYFSMVRVPDFMDEETVYRDAIEHGIKETNLADAEANAARALAYEPQLKANWIAHNRRSSWASPMTDNELRFFAAGTFHVLSAKVSSAKFCLGSCGIPINQPLGMVLPISPNWAFAQQFLPKPLERVQVLNPKGITSINNGLFRSSKTAVATRTKTEMQNLIAANLTDKRVTKLLGTVKGQKFMYS